MDGIAWAGSAMVAARARLEIAAENLANASTDGFARVVARGKLTRTGVAIERTTDDRHGAMRATGRDFDLAIAGSGTFAVRDPSGATAYTRNGAFMRERDGTLTDARGRKLLGSRGVVHVYDGASIDDRGRVLVENRCVDRIPMPSGSRLCRGFLETSGVDAVAEMVDVMGAQRSFESAQKVVSAIDRTREKSSDAARVK